MIGAVETLLNRAIDYAGLFPPAALDLQTTVANYAGYLAGPDAWALGRFVLPASRLAEFADRWPEFVTQWPISLLVGSAYDAELQLAVDAGVSLDCIECKPVRLADVGAIRRRLPDVAMLFVEGPAGENLDDALSAIADAGGCAKLRSGGLTQDAIPQPHSVAAFLVGCVRRGLRTKATAGLHHAVRGQYPLTYEPDSATACMHGFVNFFAGAVAAHEGGSEGDVERILEDADRNSFRATEEAVEWRDRRFFPDAIQKTRERLAISFGSCSFEEPIEELRSMGWIA